MKELDVPPHADERLQKCQEPLRELAGRWPEASSGNVWWDHKRGVWTRRRRRATYRCLYGRFAPFRGWPGLRTGLKKLPSYAPMGRWSDAVDPAIDLPNDAVLVHAHNGVVIVSASAQRALKLVYGPHARRCLQREIDAQAKLEQAGIAEHVPSILEQGTPEGGYAWTLSTLAPNRNPLHMPLRPGTDRRALWRTWLQTRVLPLLEQWYEVNGVTAVNTDDMIESVKESLADHPQGERLRTLHELAVQARPKDAQAVYYQTVLHGDLRPEHIHRDGDAWWLIDWGMAEPGHIGWEFFPWQHRHPTAQYDNIQTFWAWLRGESDAAGMSANVRHMMDLMRQWLHEWQGQRISVASLRYQLLGTLLNDIAHALRDRTQDRALVYNWEEQDQYTMHEWVAIRQLRGLRLVEDHTPEHYTP